MQSSGTIFLTAMLDLIMCGRCYFVTQIAPCINCSVLASECPGTHCSSFTYTL